MEREMDLKEFWKKHNYELPKNCSVCDRDMADEVCSNLKDTCIDCCGEEH